MTEFVPNGAAIPPRWTLRATLPEVQLAMNEQERVTSLRKFDNSDRVNLVENLVKEGTWPIVDQRNRNSCCAFAVTAAEELTRYLIQKRETGGGKIENLSEEQLYFSMRKVCLSDIDVQLTQEQKDNINEDGSTFLSQAVIALENTGLCAENLMQHNDNPEKKNQIADNIPADAIVDANSRRLEPGDLEHRIIEIPENGMVLNEKKPWKPKINEGNLSDIFLQKLKQDIPIAASFPLLEGFGMAPWFGKYAEEQGQVIYQRYAGIENVKAVAGHAVCIIGFEPHETDSTKGWFLIRNSLGTRRFARFYMDDDTHPIALSRGYGYISVEDVDDFCWEYMCRAKNVNEIPIG